MMLHKNFPMLSTALSLSFFSLSLADKNMESLLCKKIMDGYDKHARPARNVSDPVHVHFQLELQQIIDVDEKNQVIQLNVWLHFEWVDYRLQWDPDEFAGLQDVRFPFGMLWKPDVLLFNSVDAEFDTSYRSNMIVDSSGGVVWIPPGITRSSCKIDIRYFPFDDQECYMKYGSWTFGTKKLTLHVYNKGIDTTEYQTLHNDEWILMGTPIKLEDYFYNNEWYQLFYIYLRLRRRTLYYAFNIIIPSLLIAAMSLVGFALPVEAGEKIALEITVLASICVCFDIVTKVTPPTSESIPLLGIFFFCHMIIVTISTVANVIVLNLNYRTVKTHKMGNWTKKVLLNWMPWMLMMDRPNRVLEAPPCVKKQNQIKDTNANDDWCHICQETGGTHHGRGNIFVISPYQEHDDFELDGNDCRAVENRVEKCLDEISKKRQPQLSDGEKSNESIFELLALLQQLYDQLKFLTDKAPDLDEEDDVKNDWQFAAMVIDRLCLVLFTLFVTFSTMFILFSAPHVMA